MVATIAATEVFYRLVEMPCQTRARKVSYRRKGTVAAPGGNRGNGEPTQNSEPGAAENAVVRNVG
jgi:hypothetical protein